MLTEEQLNQYRLEYKNGWHYSKQGLVLTNDENENVRKYLSKVYTLNEIGDKNQKEFEMIKRLQNGGEKEKTKFQKFIEKLYEIWKQ